MDVTAGQDAALDVVGIGNAIMDVIAQAPEEFLSARNLPKGAMRLIETDEAERLYGEMGPGLEMSGGSAGNTMAGIASLGGRAAYLGKVADDQLGTVYRHDMRAIGVAFDTTPLLDGLPTARSLILVTPDGQRTMNTYLGATQFLTPDDVDPALIRSAKVTYMEGYLWDRPAAKEAFLKAARLAHAAGRQVSLTLSDSFCVERHRDSFRELVAGHVDILFANEAEIQSLYQTDFDGAVRAVTGHCAVAVLTRSEKGALILAGDQAVEVAAEPVAKVVDSTGAGDLFAAGFLYGHTQGRSLADSGRIGAICAAEIISQYGPRPMVSLKDLVARTMG